MTATETPFKLYLIVYLIGFLLILAIAGILANFGFFEPIIGAGGSTP